MTLQKDRTRINIKGGGLAEISTDVETPSWQDLGYLQESQVVDNTDTEDSNDETGLYVGLLLGNEKVTFQTTLKQTSLDEFNLVRNNKGNDLLLRYQVKLNNGKWQLWAFGLCQIMPGIDTTFNTSERQLPVEFVLLPGASTGKYYDIAETDNDPPQAGDWPDVS